MNPNLVASLLASDPNNAVPQSNALGRHTQVPSPAPAINPRHGGPIAPNGPVNPRRPRNMPGMNTPRPHVGPPGPPPLGPYSMPPGAPGGMGLAIDPYGNIVGIPGPDPFDPMHRAPPGMMGPPMGHDFSVNINSNNYGDIDSAMILNDDMIIINGRDWSAIPPWQWPPRVMEQYQRGMQAGAQGMAAGAQALQEADEMMHNMGLGMGMGMGPWGMHMGGGPPPPTRRRNRRR